MLISLNGETYQIPTSVPFTPVSEAIPTPQLSPPALSDHASANRLVQTLAVIPFTELKIEIDIGLGAVWCFQQHTKAPSFVPALLRDIRMIQRALQDFHRDHPHDAQKAARFLIWASDKQGIFNLGGDLEYFKLLIQQHDEARLRAYALSCIDVCYTNACALNSPMIVGALVAGDALGGGFESALSCDFMIAESQAKFGLPEILYGLFPGMGASSFLSRKVGQGKADALILHGDLHPASAMQDLGLVERVAPDGQGRSIMNRYLTKAVRNFNAFLAVNNARRRSFPLSFQEMADITDEWVKTAMRLTDRDLRRMQKLTSAQANRIKQATAVAPPL